MADDTQVAAADTDANPFAKFKPTATENPFAKFAKPSHATAPAANDTTVKRVDGPPNPYVEGDPDLSMHDLGQMGRGAVAGVVGLPGDIEKFGLMGLKKLGLAPITEGNILPSSEGTEKALFGAPKDERDSGYREIGALSGGMMSPSAVLGGAKGVAGAARGAWAGGKKALEVGETAIGKEAAAGAESLRGESATRAADVATSQEDAAQAYKKKIEAADRAQEQLAAQPATAESRAQLHAMRSAPFSEEQGRVLEDIRSRTRALEREHTEAGMSVATAKKLVADHDAKIAEAEQAVTALEGDLLARPRVTAEEFGKQIRKTTEDLDQKYRNIRAEQSGFKAAIEGAHDIQRVDTKAIQETIDKQLKDVRNPTLERTLGHVKELLQTDGKPALTIRSADSLRGYLDSIIHSKMVGDQKIDKETVYFINQIKKQLVKTATDAWQPYREALGRFRTLSRPLDIVERNGSLKKVLDSDPLSTDYKLTEAQVVGEVVRHSRNGNPVFSRLLQESPELKEPARLYFTQDLFGKDAVPTEAALRTWLKANEGPLRQLGLYNEFKDIKSARETAGRAVQEAKAEKQVSVADLRKAQEAETAAGRDLSDAQRLREKQKGRIEQSEKAIEDPAKRIAESDKRAGEATRRLGQQRSDATSELSKRQGVADRYRQFETQITTARPTEVVRETRAFVKRLRDDKLIDDKEYGEALKKVQQVEDAQQSVADTRKALLKIAAVLGAGGIGYEAAKIAF
jgi:hypothetical protein